MNVSYSLIQKMRNHGLTSDYKCAIALGVMPAQVSGMKSGKRALNPIQVYKLGQIAGMSASEILDWVIRIESERPKERAAMAATAAGILTSCLLNNFAGLDLEAIASVANVTMAVTKNALLSYGGGSTGFVLCQILVACFAVAVFAWPSKKTAAAGMPRN